MKSNRNLNEVRPWQVTKETLKAALQSPVTLYPGLVGFMGGVSAALFGANPATLALLAGGVAIATGGWAWEYFGRGTQHARRYLLAHQQRLEEEREQSIRHLRQEFESLHYPDGIAQIDLFDRKYSAFINVLNRKLPQEELTYHRYRTMTEQLFLNGLDNLENVVVSLHALSGIDVETLDQRISDESVSKPLNENELAQLRSQRDVYDKQQKHMDALLLKNEEALTRFDQVSAGLANTDFSNRRASMAMDDAIIEVMHLISRNNDGR